MAERHENTRQTEERSYERCREAGIPKDNARKIARDAADITSRTIDRQK